MTTLRHLFASLLTPAPPAGHSKLELVPDLVVRLLGLSDGTYAVPKTG